jgi:hypothetical protein
MKQDITYATPQTQASTDSRGTLLRVALVTGLLWYSLLGWLIATSDPANVNVRQIAASDAVVRATVDVKGGVHVDHVWRGNVDRGPLNIAFPEEVARPGDFFIPLRRNATGWEITPAPIGDGVRLVYPATEATVTRMRELLDE